jgi:hypothetical protein
MSAIIQANPLEKLPQEPLPTGDSCVLVIFGVSGDLTKRKLIPSLYNRSCEGCMKTKHAMKSSTYRTEMSIARGNCGLSSSPSTTFLSQKPLAMSTVSEMSEKAPLWDSMVARYGLHATPYDQICKLGVRRLDAQLPGRDHPEHNQDSSGRLCGLHRHAPGL